MTNSMASHACPPPPGGRESNMSLSNASAVPRTPMCRSGSDARFILDHPIKLTALESEVFDIVKATATSDGRNVTARVAGGWVRDKILGRESDDIDIAVDTMSGQAFAKTLKRYLDSKKGNKQQMTGKLAVIKANPDQSKHLETATMKILGTDIDFVHLRTERYTEGSRIPDVAFGSAEEDAYRRDLTINALFYNINTSTVEDFTGKGFEDLRRGIIGTPLPARKTFLDDPLRVLRALRFAFRFDFKIAPEIIEGCKDPAVRLAFQSKVSRERVGVEMKKIIKGPRALKALTEIFKLGLHRDIFRLPPPAARILCGADGDTDEAGDTRRWASAARALQRLEHDQAALMPKLRSISACTPHTGSGAVSAFAWEYLLISCVLHPFHAVQYQKKARALPVAQYILLESLKWPKKMMVDLTVVSEESARMRRLLAEGSPHTRGHRVPVGMLLRRTKGLWPVIWAVAALHINDADTLTPSGTTDCIGPSQRIANAVAYYDWILAQDLPAVARSRPPLNGKALMGLGVSKGPEVGVVMTELLEWFTEHPRASVEDCTEFVRGVVRERGNT